MSLLELHRKITRGQRFSEAERHMIGRCVFEVETRTSAEILLVVRRQSGVYRDADYLAGLVLLLAALACRLFATNKFDPLSIPVPLITAFLTGAVLSAATGRVGPRRWFTTSGRRRRQTEAAARAVYFDKNISHLESRAGVLLYYSELEHWAVLLGDRAVQSAIQDPALRDQLAHACQGPPAQAVEAIGGLIRTLGVRLERELPLQGDKTNVLEDAPDL